MDGYYVKLIGPTEAGPYGLVSEKNLSDITPHYLVNGLLPYTKYKLEVYVKNSNGLYNPDLALEIFGQTKPYIPNPPKGKKKTGLKKIELLHIYLKIYWLFLKMFLLIHYFEFLAPCLEFESKINSYLC